MVVMQVCKVNNRKHEPHAFRHPSRSTFRYAAVSKSFNNSAIIKIMKIHRWRNSSGYFFFEFCIERLVRKRGGFGEEGSFPSSHTPRFRPSLPGLHRPILFLYIWEPGTGLFGRRYHVHQISPNLFTGVWFPTVGMSPHGASAPSTGPGAQPHQVEAASIDNILSQFTQAYKMLSWTPYTAR